MMQTTIGELFQFIRNGMNIKQDKSGNGIPITRIETIWNSEIDSERVGFAGLTEKDAKNWLLEKGDILFSHINSVEHIGKCAIYRGNPEKLVHGMNLLCLRCDSTKLNPDFAKYLLRSSDFKSRLSNYVNKAVNQASVSIGNLKTIKVVIPNLEEQKRIADILDKTESLRAKRREAITLTSSLTQSIFLEMFGNPRDNSKSWPQMKFGEVCDTRLGKMLDAKKQTGKNNRPYLRNANVQWGRFDLSEVFEMDFNEEDRMEFSLKKGDVLICEGGEVGRAAVWSNDLPECYFQKALHRARPNLKVALPEYIRHLMEALANTGALTEHTTSVTIAHLTGIKLKNMMIPIPPIELQQRFEERIAQILVCKAAAQESERAISELFSSIQQKAFCGEL